MDARFSRNDLIRRIEAIASKKQFISLYNRDAENFIVEVIPQLPVNTFVYCDPPYFKKSNRLYLNHYKESDHSRIAKTIQDNLSKRWIVSYDGAPQILECYKDRRKFLYNLQYNASRVYKGQEVFIFSDDAVIPTQSILPHVNEALPTKALNLFA